MAEVATGVLHNVGNVLNSVNVSATPAGRAARPIAGRESARATDLLARTNGEPRARSSRTTSEGKLLPGYLAELGAHLVAEQDGDARARSIC